MNDAGKCWLLTICFGILACGPARVPELPVAPGSSDGGQGDGASGLQSPVGGPCGSTSDCAAIDGGAECFTQSAGSLAGVNAPGGYCTSMTCDPSDPSATCGAGTICSGFLGASSSFCEQACQTGSDCRSGYDCQAGGCVPGSVPMLDGGSSDAGSGSVDAGWADAGPSSDAGVSSVDAGQPAPDAGPHCGELGEGCCAEDVCLGGTSCQSGICAQTRAGQTGQPCSHNGDCQSQLCLSVGQPSGGDAGWTGNVCTTTCQSTADCVPGWNCETTGGSQVCECTYSPEICDGLDNDCDGIVDNEPVTDQWCDSQEEASGVVCASGMCVCPDNGSLCDGACLNTQTDPDNCGFCGNTCGPGASCTQGSCVCPQAGLTSCQSGCTNVSTDDSNCGFCGHVCDDGIGSRCVNGSCTVGTCNTNNDCPEGDVCVGAACVPGCASDEECPGGERCEKTYVCGPAGMGGLFSTCASDADCASGFYCDAFLCFLGSDITGCVSNYDCSGNTSVCDRLTNSCVECTASSQCNANQMCLNNSCSVPGGCNQLLLCASACSNQTCVQTCVNAANSEGIQLYDSLSSCLAEACPPSTTCSTNDAACKSCKTAAGADGGTCSSELAGCQQD